VLEKWKGRRGEGGGDSRHLDPDLSVPRTDDGLVGQAIDGADTRAEVVLLERPYGLLTRILELLRLQVEHGSLAIDLCRWEIQRVAQSRIERQAIGHLPVVLNEVFLNVRALLNIGLLEIDIECLHLSQQEAREGITGGRDAGEIAPDYREGERSSRPWRLDDVEPFPPPVETHLHRMSTLQPG